MTKRLTFFAASGLLALACSSAETPNDKAAAGATSMAGAGKPGAGGTGGTGGAGGAAAGTTAMGSGGVGTGGTSAGTTGTTGGSGGSAGGGGAGLAAGAGGTAPMAGAPGAGAPGAGAGGGSGTAGAGGAGAAGGAGGQGAGGAAAGAAGSATGGMGGVSSTASFTCNLVLGIDSTSEWFTSGFETQVPNDKWELIYNHPGYVQDWEKPDDAVYTKAVTSACTMNSTSPDRIILNLFADGADTTSTKLTDKDTWVTGLNKAIATLKTKYANVKRIDLLTMTRAPNNTACMSSNRTGSVVEQFTDDAIAAVVAAATGTPQIVASPKFFAKDCTIFDSTGGPHFSDPAGKMAAAKLYGDYYSTEP